MTGILALFRFENVNVALLSIHIIVEGEEVFFSVLFLVLLYPHRTEFS